MKALLIRFFRRIINLLNFALYSFLYDVKRFSKHSDVSDHATNPNVGMGFGLARTTDPFTLALLFLRFFPKTLWLKSTKFWVMDLGCGDGTVLRLLEILKVKKIVGVEGDSGISELAKRNTSYSIILQEDFTQDNFFHIVSSFHLKVIFAFNPVNPNDLVEVLVKLMSYDSILIILRNPKAYPLLSVDPRIILKVVYSQGNYMVVSSKKS